MATLTQQQRYNCAAALSVQRKEAAIARLYEIGVDQETIDAAAIFMDRIDPLFKKRDGFVPRAVIELVKKG